MATIDLGKIKIVWRGTYAGGTAYTVDDAVEHTDSGITSSFICTTASTGNAPSTGGSVHGSWAYLAKGAAGTPTTTQGDIIYRGASADARLAKGTANQTLQMNGGATAPSWVTATSGGLVKILTTTVSGAVAAVAFNSTYITSTYDNYRVVFNDVVCASDNQDIAFRMSIDNGANFATHIGAFIYHHIPHISSGGFAGNRISFPVGSDEESSTAGRGTDGYYDFFGLNDTSSHKKASGSDISMNQSGDNYGHWNIGVFQSTSAVNYIKCFTEAGGNITGGQFTLYGYAK